MPAASAQLNGFVAIHADALSKRDPAPGLFDRASAIFARIYKGIHDAQMRRAEREVARFIEARGGRMTDELERKIERHFV